MEARRPPPAGDADLVRRAQAGDRAAFERLYRAEIGRIYALCLRLAADPVRATEWAQDTFVQAWQALPRFRGDSAFGSWLHRIAINVALSHLRKRKRFTDRFHSTDDLEPYDTGLPPSTMGASFDLERAIASLPPRARLVLVLHEIEGYGHDEIGTMMNIAPGTSKAQLHRARALLRTRLSR